MVAVCGVASVFICRVEDNSWRGNWGSENFLT